MLQRTEVRAAIVEYMRLHEVEFAGFDELSGGNYGEYLKRIAASGAWGGHPMHRRDTDVDHRLQAVTGGR